MMYECLMAINGMDKFTIRATLVDHTPAQLTIACVLIAPIVVSIDAWKLKFGYCVPWTPKKAVGDILFVVYRIIRLLFCILIMCHPCGLLEVERIDSSSLKQPSSCYLETSHTQFYYSNKKYIVHHLSIDWPIYAMPKYTPGKKQCKNLVPLYAFWTNYIMAQICETTGPAGLPHHLLLLTTFVGHLHRMPSLSHTTTSQYGTRWLAIETRAK
uniref:Uncharacterized protein n=1 Tax=Romanomermis culicivorax TaxID=13658 RepID=A0A915KX72_ROMCU